MRKRIIKKKVKKLSDGDLNNLVAYCEDKRFLHYGSKEFDKRSQMNINKYVRAFPLINGTIFTISNKEKEYTLEFEDNMLYEVVFKGYDNWMQSVWKRTGIIYTIEEMNNLTSQ